MGPKPQAFDINLNEFGEDAGMFAAMLSSLSGVCPWPSTAPPEFSTHPRSPLARGWRGGQPVVLSGLVSRPELNGAVGVLAEWVEVKKRWSVKVKTKGCNANEEAAKEEELLGLKPCNLTLVAAPPGRVVVRAFF